MKSRMTSVNEALAYPPSDDDLVSVLGLWAAKTQQAADGKCELQKSDLQHIAWLLRQGAEARRSEVEQSAILSASQANGSTPC